eukprot:TRINITY_DN2104_c0_g1_i2.p1 TRINITY_DN2104_c0_g1~~TRINITY_DN2104_c0_g1_i2.p1  ORF type:complete len:968 (+),score=260.87 TRINITY_DN2104_c0_g1_i2:85-2904(+)
MAARVTIRPVLILAVTAPHAAAASQSSLALTQADVRAVPPMLLIGDAVGSDEKDCSVKDPSGNKVVPNPTEGFAEFRFRRPAQGPAFVKVNAEVYCPDSLADSFWMQLDEGGKVRLLMGTKKVFTWITLDTSAPAPYSSFDNLCFPLPADGSEHTLRYFVREPGAQVRSVRLTSPSVPTFDLTGVCPALGCDMGGASIQFGVEDYCGPVAIPETVVTVNGRACTNLTMSSSEKGLSLSCNVPAMSSTVSTIEAPLVITVFGEEAHRSTITLRRMESGSDDFAWWIILVAVGGLIILAAPPLIFVFTRQSSKMSKLHNNNAVAERCAQSIAQMRLDDVAWIRDIPNPNKIQLAFIEIVDNLTLYRSFLPQGVLEHDEKVVKAPVGQVAFFFSDIVSSTKLWEADAEAMSESLELHNAIVRAASRVHGGYEVKTIGDAFMLAFSDPAAAVKCACEVQENLLEAEWPEGAFEEIHELWAMRKDPKGNKIWNGIAVRIGVGYGEVEKEDNPITGRSDYRGRVVNLSARLESTAPHGSVQISSQVHEAVKSSCSGIEFLKQPQKEMKGIGMVETYLAISTGLQPRKTHYIASVSGKPTSTAPDNKISIKPVRRQSMASTARKTDRSSASGGRGAPSHLTSTQLVQKEGTVAVVTRMDNGLSTTPGVECARLSFEVNRGASAVVTSAARTQGKLLGIIGTQAHVCWNLITGCALHAMESLLFAHHLIANRGSSLSIGVSTGTMGAGNVGAARQRFYTVCGFPVLSAAAAASEAARYSTGCLAAYLGRAPAKVVKYTYPIDSWGVSTTSGDEAVLSLEVPALELIVSAHAYEQAGAWEQNPPSEADILTVQSVRDLYEQAIGGSREAVDALTALSMQDGTCVEKDLIAAAAKRLGNFLVVLPQGGQVRRPAPFLAAKDGPVSPQLQRYDADQEGRVPTETLVEIAA